MAITLTEFNTKALQDAVEINRDPTQFLMKMFFPQPVTHDAEAIKIDIYKQNRKTAAYVDRRSEGASVTLTGYSTNAYVPPYLKEKSSLSPSDLRKRAPGNVEVVKNSGESSLEQANAGFWVGKELGKLDTRISRAEELQASQLMLTGSVTPQNQSGTTIDTISYGRDTTLNGVNNTPSVLWDTVATAQPIEDIRKWKRKLRRVSGVLDKMPTLVLGYKAGDDFLKNASVASYLDNRRFPESTRIKMEEKAMEMATYIGDIEGVQVYSYDGVYDSAGAADQYFIDPEKAVMGFADAGDLAMRHYGAIEYITQKGEVITSNSVARSAERFPVSWIEEDPALLTIQVHSAPLLVTHNPDCTLTAVCTTP